MVTYNQVFCPSIIITLDESNSKNLNRVEESSLEGRVRVERKKCHGSYHRELNSSKKHLYLSDAMAFNKDDLWALEESAPAELFSPRMSVSVFVRGTFLS